MALRQLLLLLLLLLLLGTLSTGHEYYSSTEEMAALVSLDMSLMSRLRSAIQEETSLKVLDYLEGLSDDTEGDPSDPITAYRLISRLRQKWNLMQTYTQKNPSHDFLEYLDVISKSLPEQQEVDGVALGLIRQQEIYRLEPQSIIGYDITGLNPDETHHVAAVAFQHGKLHLALQWMLETHRLLETGQTASFTREELLQEFKHVAQELNPSDEHLQALLDKDPIDMEGVMQQLGEQTSFPPPTVYETLCREGSRMTPSRQRALFCRYSTVGGNPRLMYAPVKEEEEWDHPRIIRFHNILSEQEMDMIKLMARPELSRSTVLEYEEDVVAELRVSKTAWFKDDYDPVITHTSQRIADITGLDMTVAEPLQVVNYGVGGHFATHHDAVVLDENGERIATILVYLTDVEVGGATVFPYIGAALQPKKGSAVMWFNLLQNGKLDEFTEHAGCPVFKGNKWVANKWVHERGQEFRRRCSLNHTE